MFRNGGPDFSLLDIYWIEVVWWGSGTFYGEVLFKDNSAGGNSLGQMDSIATRGSWLEGLILTAFRTSLHPQTPQPLFYLKQHLNDGGKVIFPLLEVEGGGRDLEARHQSVCISLELPASQPDHSGHLLFFWESPGPFRPGQGNILVPGQPLLLRQASPF